MKHSNRTIEDLAPLFGDIRTEYRIHCTPDFDISDQAKYLLAIHNSGDDRRILSKLWKNEQLSDVEQLFFEMLMNSLEELPRANDSTLIRYEINIPEEDQERLMDEIGYCSEREEPFKLRGFWNCSENLEWGSPEHLRWVIQTKSVSRARKAYLFYGLGGGYEKEVIFPPNVSFQVTMVTFEEVHLIEL
jgi:hypothetical protein